MRGIAYRVKGPQSEDDNFFTATLVRIYQAYEETCRRSDLVDFAELLLRSLELLQHSESIQAHYRDRFQHILVDEFQDTNTIQYAWLRAFVGPRNYVMAVGDDDQSIYSWRGAKIENIHRFCADFKDAKLIRLEQNYRSTQNILNAANALIDNNTHRLGKKLWTDSNPGQPLTLYAAFNERDEAHYIVSSIKECLQQGYTANHIAILYRSNAQSRILEECLIDSQIPYRIYGGQKFFERAEIKDALAYLRLLVNRQDDAAFERIVNTPPRGIGNSTLLLLRTTSRDNTTSLWQTATYLMENNSLNTRAANALNNFLTLIETLHQETRDVELGAQTQYVIEHTGLLAHYKKDNTEKALSRVENLEELVNATLQFKADHEDLQCTPLTAFLSHVALETGEEQASPYTNFVSLMTLHAAKGLEYPIVFMSGMEEDLFPHHMSLHEPNGLEEERRLCYVGMTRAMEKLYLIYAECRRLHGIEKLCQPSRFIHEIPKAYVHAVRPTPKISRPQITTIPTLHTNQDIPASHTGFRVGQSVQHKKFGRGTITNYEGSGEYTRLQVKFDKHGTKWLVASYAQLEPTSL